LRKVFLGQLSSSKGESKMKKKELNLKLHRMNLKINLASSGNALDQKVPGKSLESFVKCPDRSGPHRLWKCEQFGKRAGKERVEVAKSQQLCFNCFGSHQVRFCNSRSCCRECGRNHHTLLIFLMQKNSESRRM